MSSIIPQTPGIYVIINTLNGKFYIGQSQNLYIRIRDHKSALRGNYHDNKHLLAAWNKYGESAFEFRVLIYCDVEELNAIENHFLKKYVGTPECYNSAIDATAPMRGVTGERHPMFGKPRSEQTRKKLRKANLGKTASEQTREKMSNARKGENGGNAKLTWPQVREIRARYIAENITLRELAKQYGVRKSIIGHIVNNKAWIE